jgi:signal transduction histidine kinase
LTAAVEVATVEIRLHSSDPELKKLLHEILAEIREPQRFLTSVSTGGVNSGDVNSEDVNPEDVNPEDVNPEETQPEADLWLWDYEPGKPFPMKAGFRASRHLFLVRTKDLAEFRTATGSAEANILLKPVTRDRLKTVLGMAIAAHADRISDATSRREERDDLLQCLIQTSLHLQNYEHERTSFLARAAHDFRAPLTAVNGYCSLLLEEHLGSLNETQKEVLLRMQHSARRLSRMSSAMFELSVGRQVKRRPKLSQNDIRDCLEQALHEIATFADEKRIEITTDLAHCDFPLYFEAGQIEQVLINILDNACKFTPKAGVIAVSGYADFWEPQSAGSAASTGQRWSGNPNDLNCYRIDIQDSGAPIPAEHLPQIFEEYTSYDGNGDRSGGGLGLAITRMIMAQHDGHVWAENTAFGPRFSLVLPRRNRVNGNSSHN